MLSDKHDKFKEIDTLKSGDFFGEISLITGSKANADIKALEDCVLLRLEKSSFKKLITKYPGFKTSLSNFADARIDDIIKIQESKTTSKEKHQTKKTILKRLLNYLEE